MSGEGAAGPGQGGRDSWPWLPPYLERLAVRTAKVGSVLCLGLDPDPDLFPADLSPDPAGLAAYGRLVLAAALPHAAAVKANLAFFEAFGAAGLAVLEELRSQIPADLPFVLDGKRGDIGSTSARQAVALFDRWGADAVTANPYLGRDALEPLLARRDRFVYLLCRTSNPGAGEFQDLLVREASTEPIPAAEPSGIEVAAGEVGLAEPLFLRVARRVAAWGRDAPVGLVVGATAPAELERIREVASQLPFLVPGVGAQGGAVEPVLAHGPVRAGPAAAVPGGGLLVNVSRGILRAAAGLSGEAAEVALAEAAREWSVRLKIPAVPPTASESSHWTPAGTVGQPPASD